MKLTALFFYFVVVCCGDDTRSSEIVDYTKELGTCNQDEPKNINAENALSVALLQGMVDRVDQKTGHRQMVLLAKGRRRFMKQYGKHDWEDAESKLDEGIRLNCSAIVESLCNYAIDVHTPPELPCNSKRKYYRGNTKAVYTVKEALGNDFVLPMNTAERLEYCENWTKLTHKLGISNETLWDTKENGWLTVLLRDYGVRDIHG